MTEFILFLLASGSGGGWYLWTGHVRKTRPCRRCGGWGYTERRGFFGSNVVPCRACDGTGKVFRVAARRVQRRRAARAARMRRVVSAR